ADRIDPPRRDSQRRGHWPVLHYGPDLEPESGPVEPEVDNQQTHQGDADNEDAVDGDGQAADRPAALQSFRQAHGLQVGTKLQVDQLLQDHAHTPGGQERVERPAVQKADQANFEDVPDQGHNPKRSRDSYEQVEAQVAGIGDDEGGVGAEH